MKPWRKEEATTAEMMHGPELPVECISEKTCEFNQSAFQSLLALQLNEFEQSTKVLSDHLDTSVTFLDQTVDGKRMNLNPSSELGRQNNSSTQNIKARSISLCNGISPTSPQDQHQENVSSLNNPKLPKSKKKEKELPDNRCNAEKICNFNSPAFQSLLTAQFNEFEKSTKVCARLDGASNATLQNTIINKRKNLDLQSSEHQEHSTISQVIKSGGSDPKNDKSLLSCDYDNNNDFASTSQGEFKTIQPCIAGSLPPPASLKSQTPSYSLSSVSSCSPNEASCLGEEYKPSNWDVVCGRGRHSYCHIGNRRFRILVASKLQQYVETKLNSEKSKIVKSIVDQIHEASPAAGFVKQDSKGKWHRIDNKAAREKVAHTFRDYMTGPLRRRKETNAGERRKEMLAVQATILRSCDLLL